jgi:uncharacterized protein (UPF0297 family)
MEKLYKSVNGELVEYSPEEYAQAEADKKYYDEVIKPNEYKQLRAKEYPPINDYIDGVVKGDQAQIDKYIADCLAVKAKYPKGVA